MIARNTWWAAVAAFAVGGSVRADVLYATGFENPPFAANSQLVGQQGWIAPVLRSPNAATVSTAAPRTGAQGVRVRGADLVTDPALSGFGYDALGSYRRPVGYDTATGSPVVRAQADVRLDGPGTVQTGDRVTGDFVSANLALQSVDGILGELSVSADGHVYGYGPNAADGYLFGVPVALGVYHTLGVEANFQDRTVSYFLDGGLLGTVSFADPSLGYTSTVVDRGSLVMYANLPGTAGSQTRGQYTAFYDNFSITATPTPEPAGVAVFGGLLAAGGWAVRRSKG